jgi:hypothetical protein
MSATLRLKQLLFIAAALALVSLGFVAAISTASPARADDSQPCEPDDQVVTDWFETDPGAPWVATGKNRVKTEGTDATYTEWVNVGAPVRTETNAAPGANGDLVQYLPAGTVEEQVQTGTKEVFDHWQRYSLTGGSFPEGQTPAFPDPGDPFRWVANVQGDPHGVGQAGAYSRSNEQSGNTDWFYLEAVMKVVPVFETDIDYLWQKQVRTLVPGTDDVIEYEYSKTIEGVDCPTPEECVPEDYNGQERGCGTPPEQKPWICHPVNGKGELGNGWNLINPNDPSSHIDESVYPDDGYWEHMSNDGLRHDVYADLKEGEDGKDQSDYTCPGDQLTEVTPHADGATDDCDPDPFGTITVTAVEGVTYTLQDDSTISGTIAANGTNTVTAHLAENYVLAEGAVSEWTFESSPATDCPAPPCEETEQGCPEPPCEETEQGCPEPPCEETEQGCVDPGPTCQEDPTQPRCDEDKPPVVVPDDGATPNSPSNGPTVKGASATAPTVVAGQTAGTPAVQVPTAVNSGLGSTQQELAGNGGALGLLGIATALLGAALVGLTIRPKRRIAAALRART